MNEINRSRGKATSAETRQRKRNFRYIHVSKRLLVVDVPIGEGESLTTVKQVVLEPKGRIFKRAIPKLPSKRDKHRGNV
jgi:hypothetical protein